MQETLEASQRLFGCGGVWPFTTLEFPQGGSGKMQEDMIMWRTLLGISSTLQLEMLTTWALVRVRICLIHCLDTAESLNIDSKGQVNLYYDACRVDREELWWNISDEIKFNLFGSSGKHNVPFRPLNPNPPVSTASHRCSLILIMILTDGFCLGDTLVIVYRTVLVQTRPIFL